MGLSLPHILILAVVAALLLGGGRFSALMGDVAKGVKNFKKGMSDEENAPMTTLTPPPAPLIEGRTAADIIAEHERTKAASQTPNDPVA
ncbi:twin-arginine translocase TatA/TatE family subunit [Sphingomonas sp.]|uniref:twin-arginine translocase TatA/TatE family subunit n=1 Tax=Sphingomonas sp. TaxID=28214 RepID=UPI0025FFFB0B|nr:twin-arginine translocase TatA/TatE family subunit [Sphingomonas sp.]